MGKRFLTITHVVFISAIYAAAGGDVTATSASTDDAKKDLSFPNEMSCDAEEAVATFGTAPFHKSH